MKRLCFNIVVVFFSISFCLAQNINDLDDDQQRVEIEREREYNALIDSAQINIEKRKFEQAKKNYLAVLSIKPENSDYINSIIAEKFPPALLHIYRLRGVEGLLVNYDLMLDGVVVAQVKNNTNLTIEVSEFGAKTLSATIGKRSAEVVVNFEPGGEYYLRCGLKSEREKSEPVRFSSRTSLSNEGLRSSVSTNLDYSPTLELTDLSIVEKEFKAISD